VDLCPAQLLAGPVTEGCQHLELWGRVPPGAYPNPAELLEAALCLCQSGSQRRMQLGLLRCSSGKKGCTADNSQPRGKPKEPFRHVRPAGNGTVLRCHWARTLLSLVQCHSSASGTSYFVGSIVLVNYWVSFSTVDT